jgi:hypothetical protein
VANAERFVSSTIRLANHTELHGKVQQDHHLPNSGVLPNPCDKVPSNLPDVLGNVPEGDLLHNYLHDDPVLHDTNVPTDWPNDLHLQQLLLQEKFHDPNPNARVRQLESYHDWKPLELPNDDSTNQKRRVQANPNKRHRHVGYSFASYRFRQYHREPIQPQVAPYAKGLERHPEPFVQKNPLSKHCVLQIESKPVHLDEEVVH